MNIPPTTTPRTGSGIGPGAVGALVLDGVGIAPTLILSTTVGVGVALAVIAHDFTDGLTTVALMLLNGNTFRAPLALLLDATSPILGAAWTPFFQVADEQLLIYLGFFAGFLLYIGGSDILPEAPPPSVLTLPLAMTAQRRVSLGAGFMDSAPVYVGAEIGKPAPSGAVNRKPGSGARRLTRHGARRPRGGVATRGVPQYPLPLS